MEIADLFRWRTIHFITDQKGNQLKQADGSPYKVYLRVVGDNDMTVSRKYALKQAHIFRVNCKENQDDFIPDLEPLSIDELLSIIIIGEMSEIYRLSQQEVEIKYPIVPKQLTLKAEEEYLLAKESYFERLNTAIIERTQEIVEERKKIYRTWEKEKLILYTQESFIKKMVETEMNRLYGEALLYYACFTDTELSSPVFESMQSVSNVATELKNQLQTAYQQLVIRDTDLKK